MIQVLQWIDRRVPVEPRFPSRYQKRPFSPLYGPVLYLSLIIFNLTIAAMIGEKQIAATSLFIVVLPLAMIATLESTGCREAQFWHHLCFE